MRKRKYWIAYTILTLTAIILWIIFARNMMDFRNRILVMYNDRLHYYLFYGIITGFPLLWALLVALRSRCYLKALETKAGLLPEAFLVLLAIFMIVWMHTGMLRNPGFWKYYYERDTIIYPDLLAGAALGDIILGIRKLRKNKTGSE